MKTYTRDSLVDLKNLFHQIHKDTNYQVRIPAKLAKSIMLHNENTIIGGKVRYFELKNLGLGCYSIDVDDKIDNNVLVKDK